MLRLLPAALLLAGPAAAFAQASTPSQPAKDVYTLGELQVTARTQADELLGGTVIAGETLQTYNRQTVDQALALVPGANGASNRGRNEHIIFVRGFDRLETTLSIDGVRVYLPADNRIDFARFLTADLAEIQIAKGYVSVLDGPGADGGAINLVTKKPSQPFEADAQAQVFLDRDAGKEGYLASARIGGQAGAFYWQASGTDSRRDHFTLSHGFAPTSIENGGARDHSSSDDWRVNLKAGWQPNATDEYSLNYSDSQGQKNAPYNVLDTANMRFQSWPRWDMDSLAFLSRTRLTDSLTLRTRLYREGFENLLSSFDTAAQTTQSTPRASNNYSKDEVVGGNVELDWTINATSRLKSVFYVRHDLHHEFATGFVRIPATGAPSANAPFMEPRQTDDEYAYSAAAEYAAALTDRLDLVVGAAYAWTDLQEANDINVQVTGTTIANSVIKLLPVNYPLNDHQAPEAQAALTWNVSDAARLHASVSDRTRFPTVFERFSSRTGTVIPNPDVRQERAVNYEIGGDLQPSRDLRLTGAVFYSDLTNALIQIPVAVTGFGVVNQTRNAGNGAYYGAEVSLAANVNPAFDWGGNLTYIHRRLTDPTNTAFRSEGVPDWKGFLYANWRPIPKLTLRPNIEYAGERWSMSTATPQTFIRTGRYTLVNLSADYEVTDKLRLTAAVQNLGDQNYQLTDGYPEAGRSFWMSLRASF